MNKLAANELSLSIENFDGPIDLLAQLVSKQKIDILKVNVLEIVDQYVDYIKNNIQNLDIDSASEYLNMAAYLVEFKSRKLLPELSTEEDKNFEYERDKLLQRIIEHNKYKEIVPKLVNSHTKRHKMSGKAPSDLTKYKEMQKKDTTFTLPKSINPDRLSKAWTDAIKKLRLREMAEKEISISEASIEEIRKEILEYFSINKIKQNTFYNFLLSLKKEQLTLQYAVACFGALLDLAKDGEIVMKQSSDDEIHFKVGSLE